MPDTHDVPLSNTPEHLNQMTDTKKLRLSALLKAEKNHRADGSSRIMDLHELRTNTPTEMFRSEWAPMLQDDALVTKTRQELEAEKRAADAQEHARLLEIAEQKSHRYLKLFYVACGICAAAIGIVVLVVLRRG